MAPCFFIPAPAGSYAFDDPGVVLDAAPMRQLRADIQAGQRRECARCVCPLWRDPSSLADARFGLPRPVHA
jgi:hypothetical protein